MIVMLIIFPIIFFFMVFYFFGWWGFPLLFGVSILSYIIEG